MMAFFTNIIDLQAALSACLTVRDWEMLTETVQIPENFAPLALARLTELTLQELQVNESSLLVSFAFVGRENQLSYQKRSDQKLNSRVNFRLLKCFLFQAFAFCS